MRDRFAVWQDNKTMKNTNIHQFPLLQHLLIAGGFFAAAGFNPNLVYAQVGSSVTANTLPTGGTVAQGNAVIGTPGMANGRNTLQINQTSTAAILNWSTFNVGSNGTVSFQQPANGVTLNRVNSNQGSEIYGQINATGSIFLVNPAGVLFAPGAQVNVGSLVASTLDISDNNFILGSQSGNYQFNSTPRSIYAGYPSNSLIKPGEIINQGTLTAKDGGTIALLGQTVRNEGLIAARLGTVALAAGQDISLQFQGNKLIKVQISQAEFDTLIDNKGIITAEGGWVLMNAQTAAGLARAVVNHSGVIEAQTVADLQGNSREGKVEILADFNNGTVNASGSVDVSAPNTIAPRADSMTAIGQNSSQNTANGGFLETSAANVKTAETFRVNAQSANGKFGTWLIDPSNIIIDQASCIGPNCLSADNISTNLGTANVIIETSGAGSQPGDILVLGNIGWSAKTSLTLKAHADITVGASGPISMAGLHADSSITLAAGTSGSGSIITNNGSKLQAGLLDLSAANSIRSSNLLSYLDTQASQIALRSTDSGDVRVRNTGNVTVAAQVNNGNLVITTQDGKNGANGATVGASGTDGDAGGSITVGSVNGLIGIASTGSAGVTLTAGRGGAGGLGIIGTKGTGGIPSGTAGNGGGGGGVIVNQAISTLGALQLSSGAGGSAGLYNQVGVIPSFRSSGAGGDIVIAANVQAGASSSFMAGNGASSPTSQNGSGGGGSIVFNTPVNLGTSLTLQAGLAGQLGAGIGNIRGANLDIQTAGSLSVTQGIVASTSGNLRLQAGMNAGDVLSLSGVADLASPNTGTLSLGGNSITGNIGSLTAQQIRLSANTLGSASAYLQTHASELVLSSTRNDGSSSGIFVINDKAVTVAAQVAGNLSVLTNDTGDTPSAQITVGAVGSVVGITGSASTSGSSISLRTGNAGFTNGHSVAGGVAGANTGAVAVNATIRTAGGVSITTGTGGITNRGVGGTSGAVSITQAIQATDAVNITTGTGGEAGNSTGNDIFAGGASGQITVGANVASKAAVSIVSGQGGLGSGGYVFGYGSNGVSGASGNVSVTGAINTQGDLTIAGGEGRAGRDGDSYFSGGIGGGAGAQGGSLNLNASVSATGNLVLRGGSGGAGGQGGVRTNDNFRNHGGVGGSGGAINTSSAALLSSGQNASVLAGAGGTGGKAEGLKLDDTYVYSDAGAGGAGGALSLGAGLSAQGDLLLRAGAGGKGGDITNGVGRNAQDNYTLAAKDGGAGGALTLGAFATAQGSATVSAGAGGAGGSGGSNGGVPNPSGASGASALISGSAVQLQAGTHLNVGSSIAATSGSVSLKAGMNTGNTLTLNGVTLSNTAADNLTLQGHSIIGLPGSFAANTLSISTGSAIGSSSTALQTQVNAAELVSTGGAGVYVHNSRSLTVAAQSAGDVSITAASAAPGGGNGANITVGSVGGSVGITATGSVAVEAGDGGNGINLARNGGQGGTVIINSAIAAGAAVSLLAGDGGAGYGDAPLQMFSNGNAGGSGNRGGAVGIAASITAGTTLSAVAGQGGQGGQGQSSNGTGSTVIGGAGGSGGSAGNISQSSGTLSATSITLQAGAGGSGGSGGNVTGTALRGGHGGGNNNGGRILLTSNAAGINATNLMFISGAGGAGGSAGTGGTAPTSATGAAGKNGGDVQLGVARSVSGNMSITAGAAGAGGLDGTGSPSTAVAKGVAGNITANVMSLSAGNNLDVSGNITTTSGNVNFSAGAAMNLHSSSINSSASGNINVFAANFATGTGTLNAGSNTASIGTSGALNAMPAGQVTASVLELSAVNGIGSSGAALQTKVSNLALTNSGNGGIYVVNTGDVTVAALNTYGSVTIRTADGITGADGARSVTGGVGGTGGKLTVGQVGSLNGIHAQSVTLQAGNGGAGGRGGDWGSYSTGGFFATTVYTAAGNGGAAGAGGEVVVNAPINASADVVIRSGNGALGGAGGAGRAGSCLLGLGCSGFAAAGANGASSAGADITIAQAIQSNAGLWIEAGRGSMGGLGQSGAQGGHVNLQAALTVAGALTVKGGAGGDGEAGSAGAAGANAPFITQSGAGGGAGNAGGAGGQGGQVRIFATGTLAGSLHIAGGAGGSGGAGGAGGAGGDALSGSSQSAGSGGTGGNGGQGGNGGVVQMDAALAATQGSAVVSAGASGIGGAGGAGGLNGAPGIIIITDIRGKGATGITGSDGLSSTITGQQLQISARDNLTINGFVSPTSGNVTLHAGMNAGNTLTLNGVSVANASTDNLSLQGATIAGLPSSLSANTISIATGGAIGSSSTALQTNVNAMALQSTVGGGIYVTNAKDVTVAARSNQGDIRIQASNGIDGADAASNSVVDGSAGSAGVNITVGTVQLGNGENLVGITTSGSGDVSLTAGRGGNGGSSSANASVTLSAGRGGSGGSVTLNSAVSSQGAVLLAAGQGGQGGMGGTANSAGTVGGNGGDGGQGGVISVNASISAVASLSLSAGSGGQGGAGGSVNVVSQTGTSLGGFGGMGGSGGQISLNAAISTQQNVSLNAGHGATGGAGGNGSRAFDGGAGGAGGAVLQATQASVTAQGDVNWTTGLGGNGGDAGSGQTGGIGGNAGHGGLASFGSAVSAGQNLNILAANGGSGGRGGSGIGPGAGNGGAAGNGGSVTLYAALTAQSSLVISSGQGGRGGNGGGTSAPSRYPGARGGSGGAGGVLMLSANLTANQNITLDAGRGGDGGDSSSQGPGAGREAGNGGSVYLSGLAVAGQNINISAGAGGKGGEGGIYMESGAGIGGRAGDGGSLVLSAAMKANQDIRLLSGTGGQGGEAGQGRIGARGGEGGQGGAILTQGDVDAKANVYIISGDGGNAGVAFDAIGAIQANRGGNGAAITLNAKVTAQQNLWITTGHGGQGGNSIFSNLNNNGANGGDGGQGGSLIANAPISTGQSMVLTTGFGGRGGNGADSSQTSGNGGNGGAGGLITLNASASSMQNASLVAGVGGQGGIGGTQGKSGTNGLSANHGWINGTGVNISAGQGIAAASVIRATNSPVVLQAGTGITNGSFGAVQVDAAELRLSNTTSGNVLVQNTRDITLGAVNAGKVSAVSTGAASVITLEGALAASGSGDAIVLAGNRFINNAGANALQTTNPTGRWLVYSNAPQNNSFGGIESRNTAVWSTVYNASPSFSQAGNRFVFATAPLNEAAVQALDVTKTFGDVVNFSNPTLGTDYRIVGLNSGASFGNAFTDAGLDVSGFTLTQAPTLSSSGAGASARRDGGIGGTAVYAITVDLNGAALQGANSSGVTLSAVDGALTVTPRSIGATVLVDSRQYDGTTNATVTGANLTNLAGSALDVSVGGTAAFGSANAGTHALQTGGVVLQGADAINYQLGTVSGSGTITQRQVTITGMSATGREYDGSTVAALQGGTVNNLVGSETLGLSGASGQFASANAGTWGVTVSGAALTNGTGLASNYVLTAQPSGVSGTISPRQVTITGMSAAGRDYDGSTTAALQGGSVNNLVGSETLSFNGASGQFASANAGTWGVTVSGTALTSGTGLASNYVLAAQPTAPDATISPRAISVTGVSANNRVYDATTDATLSGAAALTGLVLGENLSLGGSANAQFVSPNAGNGIAVNVSGYALNDGSGAGAGLASNYVLSQPTGLSANISKAQLSATAQDVSRTYDGTASSNNAGVSITGFVGGQNDSVVSTAGLSFTNQSARNAGTYSLTASGLAAQNYDVAYTDGSLTINKAALSVNANDTTRIYDATYYGNQSGVQYSGFVNGEGTGVLAGSLNYAAGSANSARNAGTHTITPGGLTAGNYDLSFANGTLIVNKANLTIAAQTDTRTYNGNNSSSIGPLTLGLGEGDFVSNLGQSFDSANAGNRTLSVNNGYVIQDLNGGNNYNVTVNNASGTISKAGLTATANTTTRTYDGTSNGNSNGVTITGFVNSETSSVVNQAGLSFTNQTVRNAGSYGLTASGLAADNYDFAYTSGNLTINKANLTISAVTDSRAYNGLAGSKAAPIATTLGAGDSLTGLSQSFDQANAGGRTLSVNSGFTLNDGNSGNNYNVTLQTASGSISKAALTVTANDTTRTYDATYYGNQSGVTYGGFVGGEGAGVLGGSLNYAAGSANSARNAGTYTITPGGLTSTNYDISFDNGTLVVNKANLTVAAQTHSRSYNGSAGSTVGPLTLGLGEGDYLNNLSQSFDSANAGARTLSVNSGYTIIDGNGGNNYNVTLQTASGTISKAGLTVTANGATRTYDGTNYSGVNNTGGAGVSYSGFVNSETTFALGGALTYGGSAQGSRNAGTYAITPGGLTAGNYDLNFVNGSLVTGKANLTLVAANDSRQYNGLAVSNAAPTAIGIVATDSFSATQSFDQASAGARTLSVNSGYTINDGNSGNNYNITLQTASGSITKASLTATANNTMRTYDGTTNGNNSGVSITGFVNNETSSVVNQKSLSVTNANARNAGNYNLTASGLAADNYDISYATTGNLTINKAALSVSANNVTRTYDGTSSGNNNGVSITGFVNNETSNVVSQGNLSFDNSATRNAGSYSLNASGLAAQNYDFAYTSGNLSINKASLTLSAVADSRQYNGLALSNAAPNAIGLVATDSLSNLSQSFDSANAGARTLSVNSGYTISDGNSGNNYNVTLQSASGSISKAGLTVTANDATRTYNGTNFTGGNGVSYSGLVNGEGAGVLTGRINYGGTAQNSRNAGIYSISASGLGAANYNISYADGSLVTNKANVTLVASTDSRVYNGNALTNATPTAIGIVAGDSFVANQRFDQAGAGNRTLNVSSYTIDDQNSGNNYNVNLQSANGSITPAALSIRANDASIIQGQTVPLLTATYLGFINGEGLGNLSTLPLINTSGSSLSPQGNYPIIASGANAPNYSISYIDGQLQIAAAPLPPVLPPSPPPPPPPAPPAPSPSPAPAGSPPAPAPAPASAPATDGTQTAGNTNNGSNSTNASTDSNYSNYSNYSIFSIFSFAPETEEEKVKRLQRLGKLFTIVGGGVRE